MKFSIKLYKKYNLIYITIHIINTNNYSNNI